MQIVEAGKCRSITSDSDHKLVVNRAYAKSRASCLPYIGSIGSVCGLYEIQKAQRYRTQASILCYNNFIRLKSNCRTGRDADDCKQ